MMETVLDIGLNDHSVIGLAKIADDERFAWDSYRRLIQMFGKTVLEIDGDRFEVIPARAIRREGPPQIPNWVCKRFVPSSRVTNGSSPNAPVRSSRRIRVANSNSRCWLFSLVEYRACRAVSPTGADPRMAGDGCQRSGHGLRKCWRGIRHWCRLHA